MGFLKQEPKIGLDFEMVRLTDLDLDLDLDLIMDIIFDLVAEMDIDFEGDNDDDGLGSLETETSELGDAIGLSSGLDVGLSLGSFDTEAVMDGVGVEVGLNSIQSPSPLHVPP